MQPKPILPAGNRSESGDLERPGGLLPEDRVVLSTTKKYTFGEFRLTSPPARLHGAAGELTDIRFRALQVLELLVSRAGEVVSRDELRAHLWGGRRFVDHEHGINTLMHEVRKVLGDDPQRPRFVETVRGTGYRFIAPTRVTEEPLFTRELGGAPAAAQGLFRGRVLPMLVVGTIVAIIAGVSWGRRSVVAPPTHKTLIRLAAMKGEVSVPLATDLCETLGSELQGILTAEDIGDYALDVEHSNATADDGSATRSAPDLIVQSTLYKLPDAYRIDLELIDVDKSTSLWSHVYQLPEANLKLWPQLASKDLALELHRIYE